MTRPLRSNILIFIAVFASERGGGGEYPLQDGFGWTNGVTLKMLDLICPQEKPCDALPATRPAPTPSPQDKPVAAPAANDPAPAEPQKTGS